MKNKKIFLTLIVVLIILIGVSGYFVYNKKIINSNPISGKKEHTDEKIYSVDELVESSFKEGSDAHMCLTILGLDKLIVIIHDHMHRIQEIFTFRCVNTIAAMSRRLSGKRHILDCLLKRRCCDHYARLNVRPTSLR